MPIYRFYSYDVWGNEEDGFDVNDVFKTSDTVDIPEGASNDQIKKALRAEGIIDKGIKNNRIELDGDDYSIFITDAKNGKPFGELRKEED